MGRSIAELALVIGRLDGHPRLGLCLDTCHLWSSGIDITDRSVLDALAAEIDERLGLKRSRALHVNDTTRSARTATSTPTSGRAG